MLIAGKGHEDYQIFGSERRVFQDQAVVSASSRGCPHEAHAGRNLRAPAAGACSGADAAYTDVVSDSRTLARGAAVRRAAGPRFNGNDFVGRGARRRRRRRRGRCARSRWRCRRSWCADTQAALARAARAGAQHFTGPLVGVAGSNGKTTAKEMTAAILGAGRRLSRHARQSQQSHRRAADAAAPHAPSIASRSSRWARTAPATWRRWWSSRVPSIGMITNAGAEHLEGFGSLEGVARAEGEMVAGLDRRPRPPSSTPTMSSSSLWRALTPRARGHLRRARAARTSRASDVRTEVGAGGLQHPLPPARPAGQRRHRARARRRAQRRQRARRRRRGRQRRRHARAHRRRARARCARCRGGCSSSRRRAARG